MQKMSQQRRLQYRGVDRNLVIRDAMESQDMSPPVRGVDRNTQRAEGIERYICRLPLRCR